MLLRTHVATALSLTFLLDYYISYAYPDYGRNIIARLVVYATAVVLQYLIDSIGHTWRRYGRYTYPARNRYHSLPAMILIGGGVGAVYSAITGVWALTAITTSVMLLHWVEDLVTEGGVYLFGRRVRLPWRFRIRYDNGIANRTAILLVFLPDVLLCNPFSSLFTFILFMIVALVSAYVFLAV